MHFCRILHNGKVLAEKARYCNTFLSRGLGLMFRKGSAVLADTKETRAGVHMLFVFHPLDIIWLDKNKRVVHIKRNVQPFSMGHRSKVKAQYIVEIPAERKDQISIGEQVELRRY